jgi:GMP synthase (glutamine-hydrolysing)
VLDLLIDEKGARRPLRGIEDPEAKRKTIRRGFIEVFEDEAKRLGGAELLAQGTLYPDVIESTSIRGPSAKIKSHQTWGGLPGPHEDGTRGALRELFKDEVRSLGSLLCLPPSF